MSSAEQKKFWRYQIKHRAIMALGNECCVCHNKYPDIVYDCHHLDPTQKDLTISSVQTNGARSWLKVRDELKKCCLVCANCHRLIHSGEVEVENKIYFNEDHYEWGLMEYNQISKNSLTPLVVGKNLTICPKCGGKKSYNAQICLECRNKEQMLVERPTRTELKKLIREKPLTEIGRMFNVSDNAIRKWCDKYNLPRNKNEINRYTEEEWQNI